MLQIRKKILATKSFTPSLIQEELSGMYKRNSVFVCLLFFPDKVYDCKLVD